MSQVILADARATRRALIERLVAAEAVSPDRAMVLSALSFDEQSLLENFIRRGVVVAFRDGYYLDSDALARTTRGATTRAVIGTALLVGVLVSVVWYLSGLTK